MLGNLVADFVRARDITDFPDTIQAGIRLHQRIDSFTDAHPVVATGKNQQLSITRPPTCRRSPERSRAPGRARRGRS